MPKTLSQIAAKLPPKLCRFYARKKHGHSSMSHTDLAEASGLSRSLIVKLSHLNSWGNTGLETIDRFMAACKVDISQPSKVKKYLRNRKLAFVARSSQAQRRMFTRLLRQPRHEAPQSFPTKAAGLSR